MTSTPFALRDDDDHDRQVAARYGRVMRTQPRESWLVPLLVVPLCRIALSPALPEEELVSSVGGRISRERIRLMGEGLDAIIGSVLDSGRNLTDDDALCLMGVVAGRLPLAGRFLAAPEQLIAGAGLPADLTGEALYRGMARRIADGPEDVACMAFVASHALGIARHPLNWLPRAGGRYAPVARAIDCRMHEKGITTWEQALIHAHEYWGDGGWLELQLWQMRAWERMQQSHADERLPVSAVRPIERTREREAVERLTATMTALETEVQALRPIRDKVEHLRADTERLRLREAELVQARDRAHSRVEALEATRATLERELAEARRRVEALSQPAGAAVPAKSELEARPTVPMLPETVHDEDAPLPAALLAGREVFFFTGDVRRSSAHETAESLRQLGPREIRAYCVRKGRGEGPDTFPRGSLVVVDIRWLGHSESESILDRSQRSGVEHVVVRTGKGNLARAVAAALRRMKGSQELKKSA